MLWQFIFLQFSHRYLRSRRKILLPCQSLSRDLVFNLFVYFDIVGVGEKPKPIFYLFHSLSFTLSLTLSLCKLVNLQSNGQQYVPFITCSNQNFCHISTSDHIEINHLFAPLLEHVALNLIDSHTWLHTMTILYKYSI